MKARVEKITPDMAYDYLTKNTGNYRKINVSTVARYADIMRRGEWELNGEPICFDVNGKLVNGQHRLMAIVESGCTIEMLVVTGVKEDVVIYDDGKVRTAVDIANAFGTNASTKVTSMANIMVADRFDGNSFHRNNKRKVAEYTAQHIDTLKLAVSCVHSGGVTPYLMAKSWGFALAYMLLRNGRDPATVSDFFSVVNTGLPITGKECSSALVLRNMFYMQPTVHRRADEPANMHYTMLAFIDFVAGVKRRNAYSIKPIIKNLVEELWHNTRKEDGLE